MFDWLGTTVLFVISAGWGVALAGAVTLSLGTIRSGERLPKVAGLLHGLALLLIGLGLLLTGALGPTAWDTKAGLQISPFATASLLLLIGLVSHPLEQSRTGKILDLVFSWLAVVAGIWGMVILFVGG